MEKDELYYRMALSQVVGIGPKKHKFLISTVGSAQQVFATSLKQLKAIQGISDSNADAIKLYSDFAAIDREYKFIENNNIKVLCYDDKAYPQKLTNCIDSPIILYYKGNGDLNNKRAVSIIGTRSFTEYGRKITEELVEQLKSYDVSVYSGLAYGIDVISHKACVKNQIPTFGVVAHGLGSIYPPVHASIADEMLEHGGLLSEYFSQEKAEKGNFPTRNRIVAGISDATIVVETDIKGGSMITSEIAYSYNKDLFCFPGRTIDSKSAGCNFLIKSLKAQMITNVEDIAISLGWNASKNTKTPQRQLFIELTPDEEAIIEVLSEKGQIHIDEFYTKTSLNSSQLASAMLSLEMQNLINVLPGKQVCLV